MNPRKDLSPELAALEQRLGAAPGKQYWRGLEELAETPAFQELMRREFPEQAAVWPDGLSRRQFLTLMGASLALAGLSGCSVRPAPTGQILPYVRQPEEVLPGKPLYYATAMPLGGGAAGLLVESHLGRPTKIEGNPDHPASRGGTDLFAQASVLDLYDPDRSQSVTYLGQASTPDAALGEALADGHPTIGSTLKQLRKQEGEGLHILTGAVVSPTLAHQLQELLPKALKKARWHQLEPLDAGNARQAARLAFGADVAVRYDFTKAERVLALDANFLACGPAQNRYVADFMSRRRVQGGKKKAPQATMNRLYVVESEVTNTGAKADHRLALRAHDIDGFVRALARDLAGRLKDFDLLKALQTQGRDGADAERVFARKKQVAAWIAAVAEDLADNHGKCVVLAGERQPAAVHLLVHALNEALGNVGQTVFYTSAAEVYPPEAAGAERRPFESLHDLVDDMEHDLAVKPSERRIKMLLILGSNPAYTAPANFRFAERLEQLGRLEDHPLLVHLGLYQDETARRCHWHIPEAHYLESWGDARAFDGTVSVLQPLIAPLYGGKSAIEILALVTGQKERSGDQIVRGYWSDNPPAGVSADTFDAFWQRTLHDGVMAKTGFSPRTDLKWQTGWAKGLTQEGGLGKPLTAGEVELVFQQDPTLYDGRFANNGWLQELPKPLTKLTWDNAAIMSPATARRLGVDYADNNWHGGPHGGTYTDLVDLRWIDHGKQRAVRAPVGVMPGHADDSVTVHLGHGRTAAGRVGNGVGFDAYPLRISDRPWFVPGLTVKPTGQKHLLACTQYHHSMEGRHLVRSGTLDEYRRNPAAAVEAGSEEPKEPAPRTRKELPTLYAGNEPDGSRLGDTTRERYGMVIDLTACVGCKACVVACQAENNIPVVGKDQVTRGREMHWLRIDRYFTSSADAPEVPGEYFFQPVPCMQCENAPCEYVCPVEATAHSVEGLNDMTYNRCVGTRFCSNNCPYKVRRFNFFSYADYATESLRLQYNPNVTVRSRGVMEKCTYCVQRIRQAEIGAEKRVVNALAAIEARRLAGTLSDALAQTESEEAGQKLRIQDGEILTACQAACPAGAIVFGDLNQDGEEGRQLSQVRQLHDSPLNYGLLEELNTRPRTTYLAALRNPNPKLEKA